MKKLFLNPGFEIIFALSLIVILGLPPVLLAQNQQELNIKIENGDTVVNGTNIKDLSGKDRLYALRDIKHLTSMATVTPDSVKTDSGRHKFFFSGHFTKRKDSIGTQPKFGIQGIEYRKRMAFDAPRLPLAHTNRKNTQTFDFVNTDNEGISTHIRFIISDISNEDLKKMPHVEGGKFEIENLVVVPEFNTGSTSLMFSLPAKTVAEVTLVSSDGKILWAEKAEGGHFSKTFGLGLNGIYYLQIKQGNYIAVKRIVKES